MSSCTSIDSLVTPYIDGELDDGIRDEVDAHLQRCPACRTRVSVERAACSVVRRRKVELSGACAPTHLRERCAGVRAVFNSAAVTSGARSRFRWRPSIRSVRLALAATVLVSVSAALLYRVTVGATQAIAAELTADHAKCFMLNTVFRTHQSIQDVEAYLRSGFDWEADLPKHPEEVDLQLVGSRPCLYEHGTVAHLMYRHRGVPVSIFMLPRAQYEPSLLHALGHDAVVWTERDRTFVLIARAPPEQLQQVATFVKASLH